MRRRPTGVRRPWPGAGAPEPMGRRGDGRRWGRRGRATRSRSSAPAPAAGRRSSTAASGRRGFGRLLIPAALLAATVLALLVGVLPTRSYLDKRAEVRAAEAQLAALRQANADAEAEAAALDTDAEIERRAREEFGLAMPGEETYVVLPPPADPVEVPDGWPFTELETRLRAGG